MTIDTLFKGALTRYFREHLEATNVPQTYDEHKKFATHHSWKMIKAGFKGLIHGAYPNAYPFDGSTTIISSFKKLADSGRHIGELKEILGTKYLDPKYLDPKYVKRKKLWEE